MVSDPAGNRSSDLTDALIAMRRAEAAPDAESSLLIYPFDRFNCVRWSGLVVGRRSAVHVCKGGSVMCPGRRPGRFATLYKFLQILGSDDAEPRPSSTYQYYSMTY